MKISLAYLQLFSCDYSILYLCSFTPKLRNRTVWLTGCPTNRLIYYPPDFVHPNFFYAFYPQNASIDIIWYKDGRPLPQEATPLALSSAPYTQVLFNHDYNEPGVYQCIIRHTETNQTLFSPAFRLDAGKNFKFTEQYTSLYLSLFQPASVHLQLLQA